MLNSLIIKSPPGHPDSPCKSPPGYPHSSCKSPPGYAHSPCKSPPCHPHSLCKKFSPVNKDLFQFNNKDCRTMIIDITLVSLLLTWNWYVPIINNFITRVSLIISVVRKSWTKHVFTSSSNVSKIWWSSLEVLCVVLSYSNIMKTSPFLYPLKTSENLWFSDLFRGYRNEELFTKFFGGMESGAKKDLGHKSHCIENGN